MANLRAGFAAAVSWGRPRVAGTLVTAWERYLDRRHGVETRMAVRGDPSIASPWNVLRRGLHAEEVRPDDVFLDLGSGTGRVLLQAVRLPFKRVIGVEIEPGLCLVARFNLARAASRAPLACAGVEVVNADATRFQVPDDVTVAYMYKPFRLEAMAVVLDNLAASVARAPRRLRLLNLQPTRDLVLERGFRPIRATQAIVILSWAIRLPLELFELVPPADPPPVPYGDE